MNPNWLVGAVLLTAGCMSASSPKGAAPATLTPVADAMATELKEIGGPPDTPAAALRPDAPANVRRYYEAAIERDAEETISSKRFGEDKRSMIESEIARLRGMEFAAARATDPVQREAAARDFHRARESLRWSLDQYADTVRRAPSSRVPRRPFYSSSFLYPGQIGTLPFDNRLVQVIDPHNALIDAKFDNGDTKLLWIEDRMLDHRLRNKADGDSVSLYGTYEVIGPTTYNAILGNRRVHSYGRSTSKTI